MYGISTCLVLVLIVMGVSMMNNFSKMKSLQNKINVVAEGEKQTSSPDVKETSEQQLLWRKIRKQQIQKRNPQR